MFRNGGTKLGKTAASGSQPFGHLGTTRTVAPGIVIAVFLAGCAQEESFVKGVCEKLGHGIHQKMERYTTEDGFTDLVEHSVFCGVRLLAHGDRTLKGHYTQEIGYQEKRHWGYLKYTPSSASRKRAAVEQGNWKLGEWNTRAQGLNASVVLDEGPDIVNGSWSFCVQGTEFQCSDEYP